MIREYSSMNEHQVYKEDSCDEKRVITYYIMEYNKKMF